MNAGLASMIAGSSHDAAPAAATAQSRFFDDHPPLYPWPDMLRSAGLQRVCKPREAFWKQAFEGLGLAPGIRVLDVGCSTGLWLDRLRRQFGVSGVGSDISSGSIRTALRSSSRDLRFLRGDACAIPLSDCTFDLVASLDLLEHVSDQDGCVAEMVRVLKPGGRLLLWTLNRNQRYTWNWWLSRVGIDVYDRVAHDPNLLPDPDRVRDVLVGCGMRVERLTCYNAFFTLAMDEAIMVLVSLFERMGFFRSRSRFAASVGGAFLTGVDGLSRHLGRLLGWLDHPWVAKGYSNGFLVLAQKLPDLGLARRRPESLELPGTAGAGVLRGGALPEGTR